MRAIAYSATYNSSVVYRYVIRCSQFTPPDTTNVFRLTQTVADSVRDSTDELRRVGRCELATNCVNLQLL